MLNEMIYQIPKHFPTANYDNLVICVSGLGGYKQHSTIISNAIPDYNCLDAGTQCFPRYYYTETQASNLSTKPLFSDENGKDGYLRHDGITDYILEKARLKYGDVLPNITKDHIFYYLYGILHSPEYRETFASDLKRMLPRINLVKSAEKFISFSDAGKALAKLHLNYESIKPYGKVSVTGDEVGKFHVEKMRFGKGKDKSVIHYNSYITISDIPLEAYDYKIQGRSPLEWVMEFYRIRINKDSGIKQDPNDWAKETGNPRYILDLLLSLITVSLETLKIIEGLPKLKFNT
jgi:predicted helicase